MFEKQKKFARNHVVLTAVHHLFAGFGIAIVLQSYLATDPFAPVIVGFLTIGFSVVVHLRAWLS